jgi:hypothetical protein
MKSFDVKSVLKGFFNKQSGLSVFMACNVYVCPTAAYSSVIAKTPISTGSDNYTRKIEKERGERSLSALKSNTSPKILWGE